MTNPVVPWYKQFWPWVLITIPVITVIVSINLVIIAVDTEDSLVVGDYYKKGKAINEQLDEIRKARELGIKAHLTITDGFYRIKLDSFEPLDGSAITLDFHHATLSEKDFHLQLVMNPSGEYVTEHSGDISGKWHLTIRPFNQQWKLTQVTSFPRNDQIDFIP